MAGGSSDHVVLFPYMSKGHTIPLLQFGRLLLRHGRSRDKPITVTVFTTPKNEPFVSKSLSDTPDANIISLPFPENIPGIPPGVESTDKLPSMSLFVPFTRATKLLQPFFEHSLLNLPRVSFIVSDGFLWWISDSASKFDIPRLAFYGMNCYSGAVSISVRLNELFSQPQPVEPVAVPDFPWIRVRKSDLDPVFTDPSPSGPLFELVMEQIKSTSTSQGVITNTFYELEPVFVDYRQRMGGPKAWCVGPFCLSEPPMKPDNDHTGDKPAWIRWLDRSLEEGRPVLYVAFGTQAEISDDQFKEIALGLEHSEVNFLWVTRRDMGEVEEGLEERVRGMVVREWVDQREILRHDSVRGFLSHCGWNSALETICAAVPVIAWPMMAEQPLNAKMLVEELKIGVRVETEDGSVKGFVGREELSKKVKELMEGEKGRMAREKVKEYAEMAKKSMEEGSGSSWKNLDLLLHELCGCS
ncbi:PREDICTED: UDP-glycosyltransferase 90A1 [Tarenaya hassleriana]|uniref:UDP-glycosyltransferase 90A1 n=1 Tax=Tarenaya hassleriana TaxID=28532 RepID=UPI00053C49A0|nr:PREDICTED: UDP-glycosyltransferase 90A1 [Tarenaya hassleriana]